MHYHSSVCIDRTLYAYHICFDWAHNLCLIAVQKRHTFQNNIFDVVGLAWKMALTIDIQSVKCDTKNTINLQVMNKSVSILLTKYE